MGNQTSKDRVLDAQFSTSYHNRKSTNSNDKSSLQQQSETNKSKIYANDTRQSLESNRLIPSSAKLISTKLGYKSRQDKKTKSSDRSNQISVSPIRHQMVVSDHAAPLVSLSFASSFATHYHSRKKMSISVTSMTSEEDVTEPYTPPNHFKYSYDENFQPLKGSNGFILDSYLEQIGDKNHSLDKKKETEGPCEYEYSAEKEHSRQTRQHYVLKKVLHGRNIHVPLNDPKKILESACGIGLWSIETAQDYPQCQIIGMDITPPTERGGWALSTIEKDVISAGQSAKSNVQFQREDLLQPRLSFSDNHFDFVYQRDVATALPFNSWSNLINEFFRITKPGGQVELVEHDLLIVNPGPVLTQVNEWYGAAAQALGVNLDYTLYLADYLTKAGFVNVQEEVINVPIGEWPESNIEKQHGYLYKEQMKSLFKSMKQWWCNEIKVSQQEYDQVCAEALQEFEEFHCSAHWKIFTATKPI